MDDVSKKSSKLNFFKSFEASPTLKKTFGLVKKLLTQVFLTKKNGFLKTAKTTYKTEALSIENKLTNLSISFNTSLTKQEMDIFHMKTITLLKNHDIQFSGFTDQFKLIREAPIDIVNETNPITKTFAESVMAMQTIQSFPGETIEIKGSFKRFSQANCRSIPIPESFNLSTKSTQTGFPHASQHHGWSLSSQYIEKESLLFHEMKLLSDELLPKGKFNSKAKLLLKLKTEVFNKHAKEFLELHYLLDQVKCRASKIENLTAITEFYKTLVPEDYYRKDKQTKSPFNFFKILSETHSSFNATNSYQVLQKEILEKIEQENPEILRICAENQLKEFIYELNDFELDQDNMYERIKNLLLRDISFWKGYTPIQN